MASLEALQIFSIYWPDVGHFSVWGHANASPWQFLSKCSIIAERILANQNDNRRGRNTRTNGIATLRRSSTQHLDKSLNPDPTQPTTEVQVSQHSTNSAYENPTNTRYEKNQLLDIFKARDLTSLSNRDVSGLFADNWDPGNANGSNGRGWGNHDGRDNHGPDVCWESNGSVHPIGLEDMTESERSVCFGSLTSS